LNNCLAKSPWSGTGPSRNPYLNQFIQPDPIVPDPRSPQDWNRYVYARSNPLKYVDRNGKSPDCEGVPDCGLDDIVYENPLDQYFHGLKYPYMKWPKEMVISDAGVNFIKRWEGFYASFYNDGNVPNDPLFFDTCGNGTGYCTIGYGHKVHNFPCNKLPSESEFLNGITKQKGEELLRRDLYFAELYVRNDVKVKLTQTQYDALVSLVSNWGGGKFRADHLIILNRGYYVATANRIREWPVYSNNVKMPGLVRRRAAEADMFLMMVNELGSSGRYEGLE